MSYDHICGPQKQPCPTPWLCRAECNLLREEQFDKAARRFWEPGQPLNIEAYDRPSRLVRALDWIGNTADVAWRAAKEGFCNAFRDAWALLPSVLIAFGIVLACCFAAGVLVGFTK